MITHAPYIDQEMPNQTKDGVLIYSMEQKQTVHVYNLMVQLSNSLY